MMLGKRSREREKKNRRGNRMLLAQHAQTVICCNEVVLLISSKCGCVRVYTHRKERVRASNQRLNHLSAR